MSNEFYKIGDRTTGQKIRDFVEDRASADIYFRVCSIKPNWTQSKHDRRGNVANTFAVPGFFADIDIAHPKRKKSNLPQSQEIVDACLKELKFKPSIVVDSGCGVHLYWLFSELWIFESVEELAHAQAMSRCWFRTIVKPAFAGFDIDNVSDFARILRLPGSVNWKYDNKLSSVIEDNDEDYRVDELRELLDPDLTPDDREWDHKLLNQPSYTSHKTIVEVDLKISEETQKIVREMKTERPKFAKTWNRHRKDLFDDSPSTYEFALIMNALSYDSKLTNEILIEMCVWWRRTHKQEQRVDTRGVIRFDQYVNEIQKCRVKVEVDNRRVEEWDAALGIDSEPKQNDDLITEEETPKDPKTASPNSKVNKKAKSEEVRTTPVDETSARVLSQFPGLVMGPPSTARTQAWFDMINKSFETTLLNIYYVPADPHIYLIVSKTGDVVSCRIGDIANQLKWRNIVGDLTGSFPVQVSAKEWNKASQIILKCREQLDLGITPQNFMEQSLRYYLSKWLPDSWDQRTIAIEAGRPFYFENNPDNKDVKVEKRSHVCFDLGELNRFIKYQQFFKPPTQPMIAAKLAGWSEVFIKYETRTQDNGRLERVQRLYLAKANHLL